MHSYVKTEMKGNYSLPLSNANAPKKVKTEKADNDLECMYVFLCVWVRSTEFNHQWFEKFIETFS